jgi:integrase/recombinase XerD
MRRYSRRGQTRPLKLPQYLTREQAQAVLKVPDRRYPTQHRNAVLMRVMIDTGLRSAEVLDLEWRDVDLNTGKITVRSGKGGKGRVVWLNEGALEELRNWRERAPEKSPYVFPTLEGGRYDDSNLRSAVARYGRKAGLSFRLHPHVLRHTFATEFLRETRNLVMLQKTLGHSDISTTVIYTHVVDGEREEAMRGFSVLEGVS